MTPEIRQLFRQALIKGLAAAGAFGLALSHLRLALRAEGFTEITDKDILDGLDYLIGKGLVASIVKPISPELGRWKITSAGFDYAAQEGLA